MSYVSWKCEHCDARWLDQDPKEDDPASVCWCCGEDGNLVFNLIHTWKASTT